MNQEQCPFKVGDVVVYRPDDRTRGMLVMTAYYDLQPGDKRKIVRIDNDAFVVIEGFEKVPCGGVHWTAFAAE